MRLLVVPLLCAVALAQQVPQGTQRQLVVEPQGIFVRDQAAGGGTAPAANPNPSPRGLRWTYRSTSLPWITEYVSTGNRGTLAWLAQNLNGKRLSLLGVTDDQNPPVPIWEVPLATASNFSVRAADKADGAAVAINYGATGSCDLHYYRSTSTTPLFVKSVQVNPMGSAFETAISDDGRFVSVGYDGPTNVASVSVYDAFSSPPGQLVRTVTAASSQFRHHNLSGNGLWVLLATHTMDHVLNVVTGQETFAAATVSHDAHSINLNGDTFARGGFSVAAYKNTPTGWTNVLTFNDSTMSFPIYTACDVSADGSTLVVAATDASNGYLPFRVYCWRLAVSGSTLLWTYTHAGSGQYQDTPQAAAISDNGKWLVVGSWGTELTQHPEMLFFDRDAGNVPAGSIDTPGSVFDADLSGDGQFALVGTKSVHANTWGNGGEGYSWDRGGQGHRLRGTPSLGRTIRLETGGNVGEQVTLIVGVALFATPVTIPGFTGTLNVDLTQPSVAVPLGPVPNTGLRTQAVTVPNDPSMVGVALYTQAVRIPPLEIENWIQLWFTP